MASVKLLSIFMRTTAADKTKPALCGGYLLVFMKKLRFPFYQWGIATKQTTALVFSSVNVTFVRLAALMTLFRQ